MKNPNLKIILISISFVVLVGLACGFSTKADPKETEPPMEPTQASDAPNEVEPFVVEERQPTEAPKIEPQEVDDPPVEDDWDEDFTDFIYEDPPAFFIEEFDGGLSSWSYFLMNGDESKMDLYTDNGRLVFDLPARNLWVYLLYDEYIYSNVRLDTYAENLGKNTNNVSLICNYSDRFGWYEFVVTNGGKYQILVYSDIDGGYFELASGGSKNLKMGRASNSYTAICQGNYLALYINDILEKEYTDKKFNLNEGLVGLGVSSFDVLPILVEFDYFSISEP